MAIANFWQGRVCICCLKFRQNPVTKTYEVREKLSKKDYKLHKEFNGFIEAKEYLISLFEGEKAKMKNTIKPLPVRGILGCDVVILKAMLKKNKISRDGDLFRVKINVLLYEEDKCYVAYCPALELSSYGDTKQDAKNSFDETMKIFIEETVKKGTLEKVLLQLGWTLRKVPEANYIPPEIPAELINKYHSNTITEQIAFPL